MTDVTTTSAVIQYTTADCVLSSDLIVELITLNSSNYVHHYENETISSFLLLSLTPNDVVSFTLEVTVSSTKLFGITSSFTVLPTSTSQGKEHSFVTFFVFIGEVDLYRSCAKLYITVHHVKTQKDDVICDIALFGTQIALFVFLLYPILLFNAIAKFVTFFLVIFAYLVVV